MAVEGNDPHQMPLQLVAIDLKHQWPIISAEKVQLRSIIAQLTTWPIHILERKIPKLMYERLT
jgi:hypothetical protein